TLLASVIVLDQAAKWLAWRHVSGAEITPGGDVFTGRTIGGWYSGPVTGALLDLLDFGVLCGPHRRPQAQAERPAGRHRPPHVPSCRPGREERAHRRRDRRGSRRAPHHG